LGCGVVVVAVLKIIISIGSVVVVSAVVVVMTGVVVVAFVVVRSSVYDYMSICYMTKHVLQVTHNIA
jgi:hypothetical protein